MNRNSPALLWIRNSLVVYGCRLPDHPGKWRLIKRLSKGMRLHKVTPREVTVIRNGVTYRLDLTDAMDRILYYRGIHERLETRLCRRIIRPGCVCLDVGANLGYYALLFARLTKGSGTVHAFEPCPEEFERLRKNVSLNRFGNIRIHSVALSDTTGRIGITPRRKGGNTRIAASPREARHETLCTTLDEFAAAEGVGAAIDFMKIDVEGAEVKCLKGGVSAISRFKPVMLLELNPNALGNYGNRVSEICAFLKQFRYGLYTLSRKGLKRFDRMPDTGHLNVAAFPDGRIPFQDLVPWKQLA